MNKIFMGLDLAEQIESEIVKLKKELKKAKKQGDDSRANSIKKKISTLNEKLYDA